jgi:calcineurin-like phosphoesterase family protein
VDYWLITDTHFDHKMLVRKGYRPEGFEDKIDRGIARIPENSTLVHLGDICIGDDELLHDMYIKRHKHIKKILVRGNHDKKSPTWYIRNGWDFVCDGFTLHAFAKTIQFSHRPVPLSGLFDINIHGHFHASEHEVQRRKEPEVAAIVTPDRHLLLAMEHTDYQPVKLITFLFQNRRNYEQKNEG